MSMEQWHFQYKNRQLRDQAVAAIAEDMAIADFTVKDVKLKIKSLRSTYQSEVAKIKISLRSEMARENVYVPSIRWFNLMNSFMKHVSTKRCTVDNLEESTENQDLVDDPVLIDEEGSSTPQFARRPLSRKRRHAELLEAADGLKAMAVRLPGLSQNDEFDFFGGVIAMGLKKLRPDLAIEAQNQMMAIHSKFLRLNLRPHVVNITSVEEPPVVERNPLYLAM